MEKNILVLGTGKVFHKSLKEKGANLFLFIHKEDLGHIDPFDYQVIVSLNNDDPLKSWVNFSLLLNKQLNFFQVLGCHEKIALPYKMISEELGIRYINPDSLVLTTDKFETRKILDKSGLNSIKNFKITSFVDLEIKINELDFPVILKPLKGRGSKNILKFDSKDLVLMDKNKISKLLEEENYILEEFISGNEYSVESFSQQSDHHVLGITKKFKDCATFVEVGHCFPAPDIPLDMEKRVNDYISKVLDSFRVTNGPSHFEIIIDSSRNIHLVEGHCRIGGDSISDLVELSIGIDMIELTSKGIFGEEINLNKNFSNQYSLIQFLMPTRTGKIDYIKFPKIFDQKIVESNFTLKSGDNTVIPKSSFERGGYVITKSSSFLEAKKLAERFLSSVEIVYC